MTAFLFHWKFLFQNVRGGFELHDLLCSDLDGLTRSGVTARGRFCRPSSVQLW